MLPSPVTEILPFPSKAAVTSGATLFSISTKPSSSKKKTLQWKVLFTWIWWHYHVLLSLGTLIPRKGRLYPAPFEWTTLFQLLRSQISALSTYFLRRLCQPRWAYGFSWYDCNAEWKMVWIRLILARTIRPGPWGSSAVSKGRQQTEGSQKHHIRVDSSQAQGCHIASCPLDLLMLVRRLPGLSAPSQDPSSLARGRDAPLGTLAAILRPAGCAGSAHLLHISVTLIFTAHWM